MARFIKIQIEKETKSLTINTEQIVSIQPISPEKCTLTFFNGQMIIDRVVYESASHLRYRLNNDIFDETCVYNN